MISSPTCGPCKALEPRLIEVVDKLGVACSIYKVSGPTDELVMKYNIRAVPTVLLREGDTVLNHFTGLKTVEQIEEWINSSKP